MDPDIVWRIVAKSCAFMALGLLLYFLFRGETPPIEVVTSFLSAR